MVPPGRLRSSVSDRKKSIDFSFALYLSEWQVFIVLPLSPLTFVSFYVDVIPETLHKLRNAASTREEWHIFGNHGLTKFYCNVYTNFVKKLIKGHACV